MQRSVLYRLILNFHFHFSMERMDIQLQRRLRLAKRQDGGNKRDIMKLMSTVMQQSKQVQRRVNRRLHALGVQETPTVSVASYVVLLLFHPRYSQRLEKPCSSLHNLPRIAWNVLRRLGFLWHHCPLPGALWVSRIEPRPQQFIFGQYLSLTSKQCDSHERFDWISMNLK